MRKITFYLILIILQLVFVDLVLQTFYRVTNGDWLFRRVVLPMYAADDVRVYSVKPNLDYAHITNEFGVNYYTDNLGYRAASPEKVTQIEKADDVYRVLFLGPSFSFGYANNYEDAYATQIAEKLKVPGKRIEAINIGTPSQPPRWQLCWVEKLGAAYDIDMVMQTAYGSSIFTEGSCDLSPPLPLVKDGYLYQKDPTFMLQAIANSKKSAIVFYGWYLSQLLMRPDDMEQGLGTEMYKQEDKSEDTTEYDREGIKTRLLDGYTEYTNTIRESLGDKPDIVVLHLPFGYVVHQEDVRRFGKNRGYPPRSKSIAISRDAVDILKPLDITFIDPTDALIEAGEKERQYNFIDVHFTPAGNRTVADYAAPIIQDVINKGHH